MQNNHFFNSLIDGNYERWLLFLLGNIGKSNYSKASDFKTLNDYATYLYGKTNGYVYSCVKYKHNDGNEIFSSRGVNLARINVSNLSNTIFSDILNKKSYDRYMTLNTFWYKKENGTPVLARKVENAKRLNAFYVDIDCYKMGLSQETVIYELTECLSSYAIPHWTFLIKSGRGVYVVWKLRNEDGYIDEVKKKWKIVEDYLCSQLKSLGADTNATDISRVLRVPFSYNSKSNTMVEIVEFFDVDYSIYDIMAEYCSEHIQKCYHNNAKAIKKEKKLTPKMIKCANAIAEKLGVCSPCSSDADYKTVWQFINDNKEHIKAKTKCSATTIPSYIARDCAKNADDIARLMRLRHGKENGCREVALFLYRTMLLRATENASYALESTLRLNSTFASPLDEKTVIEATESAERYYKTRYNFTRKKIAEMLNINKAECETLCFICGLNCAKNRKKINRNYYLNKLKGKNEKTKKTKIDERRIRINSMVNDGFCCDAICAELNISKSTLYRDMKTLGITFKNDDNDITNCGESINEKKKVKKCIFIGKKAVFLHSHFLRFTINKGTLFRSFLLRILKLFFLFFPP